MSVRALVPARFAITLALVGAAASPASAATCSADGLSTITAAGASTSCAPYRCGSAGDCARTCASGNDCAPGFACDGGTHACVGACSTDADCPHSNYCSDEHICRSRQNWSGCALGEASTVPLPVGLVLAAITTLGWLGRRRRG